MHYTFVDRAHSDSIESVVSFVQAVYTPFNSEFPTCEWVWIGLWMLLCLACVRNTLYAWSYFSSDKQNSIDIAIPFVHNTLQKWGKPVVTRYMSLYMTRFFTWWQYRMSKQKAVGYSPYFLMFGRDPIIQSRLQATQSEDLGVDPSEEELHAFVNARGEVACSCICRTI